MNTLDLAWVSFKKAGNWYDSVDDLYNQPVDDGFESFMDEEPEEPQRPKRPPHGLVGPARTLGPEQILRLSRAQMNELMENIQNEIQRREAKKASKNVGVKGSRR